MVYQIIGSKTVEKAAKIEFNITFRIFCKNVQEFHSLASL